MTMIRKIPKAFPPPCFHSIIYALLLFTNVKPEMPLFRLPADFRFFVFAVGSRLINFLILE